MNDKRKEQYAENPEPAKASSKKYYENHKDEVLETQAQYRNDNPDKIKEKNKNNYENSKEERKQKAKERRSKYKETNSKLTPEEIYAKTPLKMCRKCAKKVESNLFYIDLSASDGLGSLCKEHARNK